MLPANIHTGSLSSEDARYPFEIIKKVVGWIRRKLSPGTVEAARSESDHLGSSTSVTENNRSDDGYFGVDAVGYGIGNEGGKDDWVGIMPVPRNLAELKNLTRAEVVALIEYDSKAIDDVRSTLTSDKGKRELEKVVSSAKNSEKLKNDVDVTKNIAKVVGNQRSVGYRFPPAHLSILKSKEALDEDELSSRPPSIGEELAADSSDGVWDSFTYSNNG